MKRVLFFNQTPLWPLHHGPVLEQMATHADAGDQLAIGLCNGALPTCPANPHHRLDRCVDCRLTARRGLSALGGRVDAIRLSKRDLPDSQLVEEIFQSQASLTLRDFMHYRYQDWGVGASAASSLISILRDPDSKLSDAEGPVKAHISTALAMARFAQRAIEQVEPDLVCVFNGRLVTSAPVVDECRRRQVSELTIEVDAAQSGVRLFPDNLLWEIDRVGEDIEVKWEGEEEVLRASIAQHFYRSRRYGTDLPDRYYFAAGQEVGQVPVALPKPGRNVAVFVSSDDEFAAVPSFSSYEFPTQSWTLDQLRRHNWGEEIHFWVRVHPNLQQVSNAQTRFLQELTDPRFTVIAAASPVDSYALALVCDVTLVFGSTMGAEAAILGKPVILAGRALYETTGCCYVAKNLEELAGLLARELPPLGSDGALRFGHWIGRRDRPFEKFVWKGGQGKFLGTDIATGRTVRAVLRFARRHEPRARRLGGLLSPYLRRRPGG